MNGYLLDTNVISELARAQPARSVVSFINDTPLETLYLSDVVFAELRFGIETATNPRHRERLEAWLNDTVRPMFEGRVLAVSEEVFLRWRLLLEAGRRRRVTFPQPDLFIAATADYHGLTVVTRDISPFERAGVGVVSPWQKA